MLAIAEGKRSARPRIRGMRITAPPVLDSLAIRTSTPEILADFTELTDEDIRACLASVADRERRLSEQPATIGPHPDTFSNRRASSTSRAVTFPSASCVFSRTATVL